MYCLVGLGYVSLNFPLQVVKFVDAIDTSEHEITAVDTGLLALKTAIHNLQSQLDNLQKRIEQLV